MIAALHLLRVIGEVAAACRQPDYAATLLSEVARFAGLVERKLEGADLHAVQRRTTELQTLLGRGLDGISEGQAEWLRRSPRGGRIS